MHSIYDKEEQKTIKKEIELFSEKVFKIILFEYSKYFTKDFQINSKELLLEGFFVSIDFYNEEDKKFFSEREGIINPNEYSYNYVPSAHGGRGKDDGKIHIYPDSNSLKSSKNIISSIKKDLIIHEIFHYFIRTDSSTNELKEKNIIIDEATEKFVEFLNEGIVQYYSEVFARKHNLQKPVSNYSKNVEKVVRIIEEYKNTGKTEEDINKILFNFKYDEIIKTNNVAKEIFIEFREKYILHKLIDEQIINFMKMLEPYAREYFKRVSQKDFDLERQIKKLISEDDFDKIFHILEKSVDEIIKDEKEKNKMYSIIETMKESISKNNKSKNL